MDEQRKITGHEGSTLNDATSIYAEQRDVNGGSHNYSIIVDDPVGGAFVAGEIKFQKGPLKEAGLNGVSDEALLAIVKDRLEGFQTGPFVSEHNAAAIEYIGQALLCLRDRTKSRQERGVEGTHTP